MALKEICKCFQSLYLVLLRRLIKISRRSSTSGGHAKLMNKLYHSSSLEKKVSSETLLVDVEGVLLRSSSIFPYFMLVALEAGGFIRGFVLLVLYPLLCFLSQEVGLKVMVMVSFCGLREKGFRVGRTVLVKYFMEDVGVEGYEVLKKKGWKKRVCVSLMPTLMVEGFLKECLEVEVVVGRELKVFGGFFTGFMEEDDGGFVKRIQREVEMGDNGVLGFATFSNALLHGFFYHCMEVCLVSKREKKNWHPLPRENTTKPIIFHDGRIAFRPTPATTLAMYLWLPFGILLAIFRAIVYLLLPYKIALPIGVFTGMTSRDIASTSITARQFSKNQLYVCNHRTLLDPVYISAGLNRKVTAVTYSLSRISEMLSPIKTVRLTRNRDEDRRRMSKLLSQGDLVVCPEGTTCREPFLLRFSPLFAELTEEVVPVAMSTNVSMFYGTTASGFKCFDSLFFLMNPWPEYQIEYLEKVPTDWAGNKSYNSIEVANHIQREMGKALGFTCTTLTRRSKYLMLADNEGKVKKN
ncbi:Glycerol-3-phosphate 1-O-acyltransferase protein [Dioscorea alata]|uniref:Glycerol-3-phosphate 1-O-acyltransferase protein n=1 Tax=Dioscorea alata TaxID=55571 RepID=A0ACB7VPB1_DIOAL|nr:Glycerol-3-phosphate 1-O-acyltransferase protein [Dioscorea alata]